MFKIVLLEWHHNDNRQNTNPGGLSSLEDSNLMPKIKILISVSLRCKRRSLLINMLNHCRRVIGS